MSDPFIKCVDDSCVTSTPEGNCISIAKENLSAEAQLQIAPDCKTTYDEFGNNHLECSNCTHIAAAKFADNPLVSAANARLTCGGESERAPAIKELENEATNGNKDASRAIIDYYYACEGKDPLAEDAIRQIMLNVKDDTIKYRSASAILSMSDDSYSTKVALNILWALRDNPNVKEEIRASSATLLNSIANSDPKDGSVDPAIIAKAKQITSNN